VFFAARRLVSFVDKLSYMFDLFRKSSKGPKVIDKVWLSKQGKLNACAQMVKIDPSVLLVAWFEETFREIESLPGLGQNVIKTEHVSYDRVVGRMVVFVEHYPLLSVEHDLYAKLQLKEVPVLSCLEDPLFMAFGGERTIEAMKNLGLSEDEVIGHSMVTRSIRNAQDKIAEKSSTDYPATSSKEWFKLNMKETK
jgi:hypothetical protein